MEGIDVAVLDAITHAVRAVQRRSEGLAPVADRHSAAAKAALGRMERPAGLEFSRPPRRAAVGKSQRETF